MPRFLTSSASLCLLVPLLGIAGAPSVASQPEGRGPNGQPARKYTKEWTDDYGNHHKEVYRAYTRTLRDERGEEVPVETWHGKATGFHENGSKSWEGEYRNGKREGEFMFWAANGVRTGLGTFQRGLLQGTLYEWNRDGRKKTEQTYENGKLHGLAQWWTRDGTLMATGTYRDGQPWTGTFPELVSPPGDPSYMVIRQYENGMKGKEKKVDGDW